MLEKIKNTLRRLSRDEAGAALVEYSVLIGIITAGVVATVVLVGGWIETQWTTLNTEIRK